MRTKIGSDVGFVGDFLFRETHILVNPIGTVFHGQVADGGVEFPDLRNQLFGKLVEMALCGHILLLVFHEPFAVVVAHQLV